MTVEQVQRTIHAREKVGVDAVDIPGLGRAEIEVAQNRDVILRVVKGDRILLCLRVPPDVAGVGVRAWRTSMAAALRELAERVDHPVMEYRTPDGTRMKPVPGGGFVEADAAEGDDGDQ